MSAENSHDATVLVARCRLIPDFNLCVAISVVCALLMIGFAVLQPLNTTGEIGVFLFTLGLMVAAPFYWLIARIRGAICLDETGVRWRTAFGSWRFAKWDEIEECDARLTSTTTARKYVVATRHGAFSFTKWFQNAEQLAPFAARFCPVIPAQIEAWPRFYNYRSVENGIAFVAFPMFGWWLVAPLWKLFSSSPRDWIAQISLQGEMLGWPLTLIGLVTVVCFATLLPAVFLWLFWQIATQNRARRDESFLLKNDGITWQRPNHEPFFVPYSEVRKLHTHSRGKALRIPEYRLETARGALSWNNSLNGWARMHRELRERAPQLMQTSARHVSDEFDAAPDPNAQTLRFGFKTRGLRAMLWFLCFATLMCLCFVIFGPPPNHNEPTPPWVFGVAFLLLGSFTSYCLLLFQRGAIQLDSRGIEWKLPFKNRFVAWSEIQSLTRKVGSNRQPSFELQIGQTRLQLLPAPFPPAHFEILLQAIGRHLSEETADSSPSSDTVH